LLLLAITAQFVFNKT